MFPCYLLKRLLLLLATLLAACAPVRLPDLIEPTTAPLPSPTAAVIAAPTAAAVPAPTAALSNATAGATVQPTAASDLLPLPFATPSPLPTPPAVALTLAAPVAELVPFTVGTLTIGQPATNPPELRELPARVEGLLAIPPWYGDQHQRLPVALLLHDALPICPDEAGVERWPCPEGAEQRHENTLAPLLQVLAARGYLALAVNLNAEYTPAFGQAAPGARGSELVSRALDWVFAQQGDPALAPPLDPLISAALRNADPQQIALVAHGRAAATALTSARQRGTRSRAEPTALKTNPLGALLLLAPLLPGAGDARLVPTLPPELPASLVVPACDGLAPDLGALALYEQARIDRSRSALVAAVLLRGATHNGFVAELPAEDAAVLAGRPGCSEGERLDPATQEGWLAAYAPAALDGLLGIAPAPQAGLDVAGLTPETLYELEARVLLSPPARHRRDLLLPTGPSAQVRNSLGGAIASSPGLKLSFCGGETLRCGETIVQPGLPGQLRLDWSTPEARLRFMLPEGQRDLRDLLALSLRLTPDPSGGSVSSLIVTLEDSAGLASAIAIPPTDPIFTEPPADLPSPPRQLRVPLRLFDSVDLANITAVSLGFGDAPRGAVLLADMAFVAAGLPGETLAFSFGPLIVAQEGVPGPAQELPLTIEGMLTTPTVGEGPHPLAVVLHLKGGTCVATASGERVWPCAPAATPRYERGYGYLAEALAARGYLVATLNLAGAFSEAAAWGTDDAEANRRLDQQRVGPLFDALLAELAAANRGASDAFGHQLVGAIDLSTIALIGHARGAEWANLLASDRSAATSEAATLAGRGPIRALLLLTPSWGDFPTERASTVPADLPLAVIVSRCDAALRDGPLRGQGWYEEARRDLERQALALSVLLPGGEHDGFNTIVGGPTYRDDTIDCDLQANPASDLLSAERERAFLAAFAPDFLDVALQRTDAPLTALDPSAALPETLYGLPVRLSLLPPPSQRRLLLTPFGEGELTSNRQGGVVEVRAGLELAFCTGTGSQRCIAGQDAADPSQQPIMHGFPPQVRLTWQRAGGVLRLGLPALSGDLRAFAALQLRLLVDPLDPRNAEIAAQPLTVALIDGSGAVATLALPEQDPALQKPLGPLLGPAPGDAERLIQDWSRESLRPASIRLPLAAFAGIDLAQVQAIELRFDRTPRGAVLLSDVELLQAAP